MKVYQIVEEHHDFKYKKGDILREGIDFKNDGPCYEDSDQISCDDATYGEKVCIGGIDGLCLASLIENGLFRDATFDYEPIYDF